MDPQTSPYYGYDSQKPQLYDTGGRNKKFAYIIIGVFAFLVILTILLSLTSSTIRGDIALVGARHGEMARVANLALESGSSSVRTKNLAASVRIHAIDSQLQVSSYIRRAIGGSVTGNDLALVRSRSIDSLLSEAAQRNTFDADFNETMVSLVERASAQAAQAKTLHDDPAFHRLMDRIVEENQIILEAYGAIE